LYDRKEQGENPSDTILKKNVEMKQFIICFFSDLLYESNIKKTVVLTCEQESNR